MSSWLVDSHNSIQQDLKEVKQELGKVHHTTDEILSNLTPDAKERDLLMLVTAFKEFAVTITDQLNTLSQQVTVQGKQISEILQILTPNPAVSFTAEITTP